MKRFREGEFVRSVVRDEKCGIVIATFPCWSSDGLDLYRSTLTIRMKDGKLHNDFFCLFDYDIEKIREDKLEKLGI